MSKAHLTKSCVLVVAASVLGAVSSRSGRADETDAPATADKAPSKDASASGKLAEKIDAYVNKRIGKESLKAVPQAEDAEFLRRVWLDICGATPDPNESIAFLADRDPDKRRKKIDELLAKPDMARNWAEFWTDVMEGEATTKRREDQLKLDFRTWFEGQLKQNVPFDELTRRVIDAEGYVQDNGAVGYVLSYTDMGNQPDPKTLAATTARVFMGLQIECAQCHDHPFADWKRQQFMELSAFFNRAKRDQLRLDPPMSKKELAKLPEEERVKIMREFQKKQQQQPYGVKEADKGEFQAEVQTVRNPGEKDGKVPPPPATAQKPGAPAPAVDPKKAKKGKPPAAPAVAAANPDVPLKYLVMPQFMVPALFVQPQETQTKRRELLGKLITSEKNPYYAKNCANRIWGRLTGRPLVAPSEDMSDPNAPHDPELLTLLAKGFRDLKCDHKQFVRAICLTEAYGRSSRTTVNRDDRDEYAKLVHLEQLYGQGVVRPIDARPLARTMISAMTLGAVNFDDLNAGRQAQGLLVRFERLFGESNMDPKKYEETIPQALFLINGQGTNKGGPMGKRGMGKEGKALTAPPSQAIANLLTRYEDPRERVTRLYLAALCRPPKKAEIDDALAYVTTSGGEGDAYEDVLWALVNSAEFRFNR